MRPARSESALHVVPDLHPDPARARQASAGLLAAAADLPVTAGPAVLLVLDGQGVVVEVSGSLTGQLGWEPAEVIGRDSLGLVHPADRGEVYAARLHLAEDRGFHAELRIRRKQGGWRVWDTRALPAPQLGPPTGMAGGLEGGAEGGSTGMVVVLGWDITAAWRRQQSLAHAASHDPLTQLPNRTVLTDRLRAAHARQHRTAPPPPSGCSTSTSTASKPSTTPTGTPVGDQLLQDVASVLHASVRGQDVAARMGGDEFAVLAEDLHPDTAATEIATIIVRITKSVAALAPPAGLPAVSVSVGTVIIDAGDPRSPEELLAAADHDMFTHKTRVRQSRRTTSPPR